MSIHSDIEKIKKDWWKGKGYQQKIRNGVAALSVDLMVARKFEMALL